MLLSDVLPSLAIEVIVDGGFGHSKCLSSRQQFRLLMGHSCAETIQRLPITARMRVTYFLQWEQLLGRHLSLSNPGMTMFSLAPVDDLFTRVVINYPEVLR